MTMGSVVSSFLYTKVPPLLNRGSDSLAKLAAAILQDSIYGFRKSIGQRG